MNDATEGKVDYARDVANYVRSRADSAARALRWWFVAYAAGGFTLIFSRGDSAEFLGASVSGLIGLSLLVLGTLIQIAGEIADKCAWRAMSEWKVSGSGPEVTVRFTDVEVPPGTDKLKEENRRRKASWVARKLNSWIADVLTAGCLLAGGVLLVIAIMRYIPPTPPPP